MDRKSFLDSRRPDWKRFRTLLAELERLRSPSLDGEDVSEFSRLFRSLCYDLSTVRGRHWGSDLELYLNDLVTRGHNAFYGARPRRFREFLAFLTHGFPRQLRRHHRAFWLALILFYLPGIVAGTAVVVDPELADYMFSTAQLEQFDSMYSPELHEDGQAAHNQEAAMTGFYVYHNVGIAFTCFATGVFFGIGTVFYLIFNSIALGGITGYMIAMGNSDNFFSFVISHGSFELTAIVVAGTGGLLLGDSLLRPGPYRRIDAMRLRANEAIQLAAGAGVMLAVAALIEGFWSPSSLPYAVKYAGGAFLWVAVIAYLTLAGRERAAP